jgi:hypothetical protein
VELHRKGRIQAVQDRMTTVRMNDQSASRSSCRTIITKSLACGVGRDAVTSLGVKEEAVRNPWRCDSYRDRDRLDWSKSKWLSIFFPKEKALWFTRVLLSNQLLKHGPPRPPTCWRHRVLARFLFFSRADFLDILFSSIKFRL